MGLKSIALSLIRTDAGTQSRCILTDDIVAEYAERMLAGDPFPPVVVFHDGSDYYLADGFHRVKAATRNQAKEIAAEVHTGTRLDALKYSVGANRSNGLRRTNSDKRRCVVLALENFADESDRAIALMCGVDGGMVASLRPVQVQDSRTSQNLPSTRKGKDGKSYPAKSHAKTRASEILTTSPGGDRTAAPVTAQLGAVTPPGRIEPNGIALDATMSAEYQKIQEAVKLAPIPRTEVAGNLHFLKGYWNRSSMAERKEFLLWVNTEEAMKEKAQAV